MRQSAFRFGPSRGAPVIALLIAVASVHPLGAQAQGSPGRAERADPLDAHASVPATPYASSLARYRRLGDDPRVDWKQANETVNRIGGWRAYAREAQQPEPAASAPAGRTRPDPASAATPAHGGHKTH